ncbi:MAG TPA: hypothetical protein VKX46_11230 [Ktedonobacteraceae bacterium]|nr:hypothetical protein [Ktedonobacteraceae bacterium]
MRDELLSWFAREGLVLCSVSVAADNPEHDEVKIVVKAPVIALSRADSDVRECPDPILFGYPDSALDMMTIDDMHQFVADWLEKAVREGLGHCFVCNKLLDMGPEKPWDAVFISTELYCWLLVHFDCKRYLNRDLKGRNPFEVVARPPEFFDMRLA